MSQEQQEKFVDEFCSSLKEELMKNIKHFPPEWDGRHIRVLAQEIVTDNREAVKSARKEFFQSDVFWKMRY